MNKKQLVSLTISLSISSFLFSATNVYAAAITAKSDTMSRLGNSSGGDVLSDHAIQFTTPTGVASGQTMVITFPSDFDGTNDPDGALDFSDVDLFEDTTPDAVCDGDAEVLVDSAPSTSEWSAVFSGTEDRTLTLTSGGATALIAAGSQVCIKIGENATGGAGNSQYINPTTSGSKTIALTAGNGVDSGDTVVSIIDNDRVTITATVDETITFSIADYAIGFGNLSSTVARFATADATGADGPTSASAHNISVSTNGSSGYEVTYFGDTLKSGDDDINVATISGDEDGAPGTEQFALGFTTSDDASIVTDYDQASPTFKYKFVANTVTPFLSESGPTDTETVGAFYLANIAGVTPAGSYSTSLTYVASANF